MIEILYILIEHEICRFNFDIKKIYQQFNNNENKIKKKNKRRWQKLKDTMSSIEFEGFNHIFWF